jgi:hypothetical protein
MILSVADIIMTHISLTLTVNKGDIFGLHFVGDKDCLGYDAVSIDAAAYLKRLEASPKPL